MGTIETGRRDQVPFDRLREEISEKFDSLSPHLQRIARYALHNSNSFALSTVVKIAKENAVQPSSVVRFAKTFGFRGFSDLQQIFRHRLIEGTPELRSEIHARHKSLEDLAENDPGRLFDDFSQASIDAIEGIRRSVSHDDLRAALQIMHEADTVFVIGQRRAFPVASYIAYGLARLELRSHFVDFVGGMAHQQVATMTGKDLLVAVGFAPYTPEVVKIVKDAHIRDVPILTITDTERSPLASHSSLSFKVHDDAIRRFRPLSPTMALAQFLILGLSYLKDNDG